MDPSNQSSEGTFRTLFERHPHAILELEDGDIQRTNRAARRMLELERDQLTDRGLYTLFQEDRDDVEDLVNDVHTPRKQTSLSLADDVGEHTLAEVTLLNDTNGSHRQFLMLKTVQKGERTDAASREQNGNVQRMSLKKTLSALQDRISADYVLLGQEHTGTSSTETLMFLSGDEELDTSDVNGSTGDVFDLVEEEFVYFRSGVTNQEDAPSLLRRINASGFAAIRFEALDQRFNLCVISGSALTSGSEVLDQLHHFAQKITQLLDHSLSASDVNYRILFDQNPVPLWIYDTDTHALLDANQAAQTVYGYTRDEFLNLSLEDLHPDEEYLDTFLSFQNEEDGGSHVELPQETQNGHLMRVELGTCPVTYEECSARLVSVRDVTRQKRALRKLERRLDYDQLTGLPNRSYFQQKLREHIDAGEDEELTVGVFYLDIDNFNKINDVLGHSFGDQVLVSIAERLQNCMPEEGLLARWAGDEFIGFLPDIDTTDDLEGLVKQFRQVLQTPVELDDRTFHLDCSIGLSLYPQDGSNPEELIGKADVAMSRTRERSGSFFEYYIEGDIEETSQELELLHEMKRAVRENQFDLYYQPFVDLDSGEVSGCEALIRWNHPARGLIQPSSFVPTAEATGLIVPIGKWVIRRACEQIAQWSDQYDEQLYISVNIAVQQLQDPDFLPHVKQTIDRTGAAPGQLQVELTESTIMNNLDRGRKMLGELQDMGVRIAIDDFGTGYSSLEYLMRLPVDLLKIDRSFTQQIADEPYVVDLFHLIRTISDRLELDVLVEGVESSEQLRKIQDQECSIFQGYLFGHPCSSQHFIDALRNGGFLDNSPDDEEYGCA